MQRRLLIGLCVLLSVASLQAWSYLGFEQITVAATAVGFTSTTINGPGHAPATAAQCRVETAEIRYTVDGTTVTSSVGTILSINDTIALTGNDILRNFRSIRTGSSSGQLDCTFSTP